MSLTTGIFLLNKPGGVTSFGSLNPLKQIVGQKVGHAGTLDKFAQGLMIALAGPFTRLNPLFSTLDKRYIARIEFGRETTTLDPEGEVIKEGEVPTLRAIEASLDRNFTGKIWQEPPIFSALHIDGIRAHKLARQGEIPTMSQREVTIYSTEIIGWEEPHLTLAVHCSKGTYIRSLARDLATSVSSCAHLVALERTAIGPYQLHEALEELAVDSLHAMAKKSKEYLLRLPAIASYTLSDYAVQRLAFGRRPLAEDVIAREQSSTDRFALLLNRDGHLVGIVELSPGGKMQRLLAVVKEALTE